MCLYNCVSKRIVHDLNFTFIARQAYLAGTTIYCGDKSGNYPGNTSRSGSGASGYWDLGESSTRTFRFSTGNEGGAPTTECYSWSPYRIYVA